MESLQIAIQAHSSTILAVYGMLLMAGILYNWAITLAEREGWLEGFIWLSVVIGVVFTLIGLALISWMSAVIALGAFASSGLPMAAGAVWRYVSARKAGQQDERQTAGVAKRGEGGARPGSGGGGEGDPISEAGSARGALFHRD